MRQMIQRWVLPAVTKRSRRKTLLTGAMALTILLADRRLANAQTSRELFKELPDAGGVHPLAQLVCFPGAGQNQDSSFLLVGFNKDFASSLRAKGKQRCSDRVGVRAM